MKDDCKTRIFRERERERSYSLSLKHILLPCVTIFLFFRISVGYLSIRLFVLDMKQYGSALSQRSHFPFMLVHLLQRLSKYIVALVTLKKRLHSFLFFLPRWQTHWYLRMKLSIYLEWELLFLRNIIAILSFYVYHCIIYIILIFIIM